jgi:hypothetical protein
MGVPVEHCAVEADRRLVVTGVQLEPARSTGLALNPETLVEAWLPDADRSAAAIADHGHRAEVTDRHGLHVHLAAVCRSAGRGPKG